MNSLWTENKRGRNGRVKSKGVIKADLVRIQWLMKMEPQFIISPFYIHHSQHKIDINHWLKILYWVDNKVIEKNKMWWQILWIQSDELSVDMTDILFESSDNHLSQFTVCCLSFIIYKHPTDIYHLPQVIFLTFKMSIKNLTNWPSVWLVVENHEQASEQMRVKHDVPAEVPVQQANGIYAFFSPLWSWDSWP